MVPACGVASMDDAAFGRVACSEGALCNVAFTDEASSEVAASDAARRALGSTLLRVVG